MKIKKYFVIILLSLTLFFSQSFFSDAQELNSLQKNLKNTESRSRELDDKIKWYNQQITSAGEQISTLKQELRIVDLEMDLMRASIDKTVWDLSILDKDLELLDVDVRKTEEEIKNQKKFLVEMIRLLYSESKSYDQINLVEVFLSSENINDFFQRVDYLNIFEKEAQNVFDSLQINQNKLLEQKKALENQKKEKKDLLKGLENKQITLENQEIGKKSLISETQGKEELYNELRQKAEAERRAIDAEIDRIVHEITIEKGRLAALQAVTSSQGMKWPIPVDTVTAGFREPSYTKRFGRTHNGIDVRAAAGTEIRAPKDGIVTKVVYPSSPKLSYLIVEHGGIQTVYLHTSKVYVEVDQEVKQGDVIAETGGVPGAFGTGVGLSTGPHLHFEVRVDGNPVNPLNYLP